MSSTNTLFMYISEKAGEKLPDDLHKWFPLESISVQAFSSARIEGNSGRVSNDGAPHLENIPFKRLMDERSPALLARLTNATEIPQVTIKQMVKYGEADKDYMVYQLDKCLVVGHSIAAHNNGGTPEEEFILAYDKISFEVEAPFDAKNGQKGEMSWCNSTNSKA